MLTHEDLVKCLKASVPIIDDDVAVKVKAFYPEWVSGGAYISGDRRVYTERLYKCRQTHTDQGVYTPDQMPALWEVIDEIHTGTIDNPIIYVAPMKVFKDKYYKWVDVVYLCTCDSGQALTHTPDQLVGIYFEVIRDVS